MITEETTTLGVGRPFRSLGRVLFLDQVELPPSATFDCVGGSCVGAGDAGEYATLGDCEANCFIECPAISLACDSITASKSKCGFNEFVSPSSPPKIYLRKTGVVTSSSTEESVSGGTFPDLSFSGTTVEEACNYTYHYDYDPITCTAPSCGSDGFGVRTRTVRGYTGGSLIASTTCSETLSNLCQWVFNCFGSFPPTPSAGSYNIESRPCGKCSFCAECGGDFSYLPGSVASAQSQTDRVYKCGVDPHFSGSSTLHLSNEYVTDDLKTNTISALPSYAGFGMTHGTGQGTSCSAFANLSLTETSYTLRRFKYKFTFDGPACAGMVLTWKEHFQPAPSGTPVDVDRSWTAAGGETESPIFLCPDPTSNGTTTITTIEANCDDC